MIVMPLFNSSFESTIFSLVVLVWVLVELIFGGILPWLRHGRAKVKKSDNGSVILIRVLMFASVLIAIFLAINNIAMLPDWFFYPGIGLMVVGIIVRLWAILVLGRFFTLTVGVQKDQKVVDYGPYRFIRHPAYLGVFLIVIGIGFAVGSWVGILILLLMNGLAIGYRMYVEEKVLVSELGDDYIQYMKRTKRLIPFII